MNHKYGGLQDPILYVFLSHRAIKDFYTHYPHPVKPKVLSIEEFFDLVISIQDCQKIPESAQKILLLQTLYNYKNLHRLLLFEESFLAYLEGSEFLKSFFNELHNFLCDITQIPQEDTYGDYQDHLELLTRIYRSYYEKLDSLRFYTYYDLQKLQINQKLLSPYKGVRIFLDGVLSPREEKILVKISKIINLEILFSTDLYNLDFFSFLNLPLKVNQDYRIQLGDPNVILEEKEKKIQPQIKAYHFNMRIDQCSLVIAKAQEWLEKGEKNVAIILPDKTFAPFLKTLSSNFNHAMGLDVKQTPYYANLSNLFQDNPPSSIDELQSACSKILEQNFHKEIDQFNQKFFLMLEKLKDTNSLKLDPTNLYHFYQEELSGIHISDTHGGKIPVYGVLETRGIHFDSIVIVDFNEETLFNFKDNDLFLNTQIRHKMHMPTLIDKKKLRQHYYHQLILNSKQVDIALVKTHMPGYFLESLNATPQDFPRSIFHFDSPKEYKEDDFTATLPSDFSLSASSLKTYLTCKRKFYFHYIEKLSAPKKQELNIGSLFHDFLRTAYTDFAKSDFQSIKNSFDTQFNHYDFSTKMEKFTAQIHYKKMQRFWQEEEKHFNHPYQFFMAEMNFAFEFCGFNFKGKIDRIDKTEQGDLVILDYKFTKNFSLKEDDYQLTIYRLALENQNYRVVSASLIDGYRGERKTEERHEEKRQALILELERMRKNTTYEKCEDTKNCVHCEYNILCDRDEKVKIKS